MEAALRETLRFRSGPDGRNKQLWSGSGGSLQGRGSLSAAERARAEGFKTVDASPASANAPRLRPRECDRLRCKEAHVINSVSRESLLMGELSYRLQSPPVVFDVVSPIVLTHERALLIHRSGDP
jgi:hypothetical protein